MAYRLSKNARRDLDAIFLYWAERAGLPAADRLIDSIVERFWLLGEYPETGLPCDEIAPGVRCFPAGKYLVYYRKKGANIDILHIFHHARDQEDAFGKRS